MPPLQKSGSSSLPLKVWTCLCLKSTSSSPLALILTEKQLIWTVLTLHLSLTWICSLPSVTSLLPVLPRSLRHLWLLWQEVHEHADLLLWGAAHLLHYAQLPDWCRRAVCHPDEARAAGRRSKSARPLQVGEVCLPLWHWQRWDTHTHTLENTACSWQGTNE